MPYKHKLDFDSDASVPVAGITLAVDGALTIERVKKDDEGLYECVATNVEGVARTSAVVTVIGRSLRPKNISLKKKKRSHYATAFLAAANVSQALCLPVAATSGFVSYFRVKVPLWSKKQKSAAAKNAKHIPQWSFMMPAPAEGLHLEDTTSGKC